MHPHRGDKKPYNEIESDTQQHYSYRYNANKNDQSWINTSLICSCFLFTSSNCNSTRRTILTCILNNQALYQCLWQQVEFELGVCGLLLRLERAGCCMNAVDCSLVGRITVIVLLCPCGFFFANINSFVNLEKFLGHYFTLLHWQLTWLANLYFLQNWMLVLCRFLQFSHMFWPYHQVFFHLSNKTSKLDDKMHCLSLFSTNVCHYQQDNIICQCLPKSL